MYIFSRYTVCIYISMYDLVQTDSPVTVEKSWGTSACKAGDWIVVGDNGDAYTVGHELFE